MSNYEHLAHVKSQLSIKCFTMSVFSFRHVFAAFTTQILTKTLLSSSFSFGVFFEAVGHVDLELLTLWPPPLELWDSRGVLPQLIHAGLGFNWGGGLVPARLAL